MSEVARWEALSLALDALLELDAIACTRELDAIAQRDPALASELRVLLAAEAAQGLLDRGIVAAAPELIATLAASAEPADDQAGRVIGRWRVLRELGRGGMGEVLLAERADGEFVQIAALKRLKRGMDSEELLRRFAQERRILASLVHPHIARLLDGGIDSDGRPFFAMEYVEGEPITVFAQQRGLGVRERLGLMQRVCEAVAYAQSRLVVHRDIKPSNILVDASGEPRLLDFGIAKLLADSGEQALTGSGLRVLSPAYAAPEQVLGETISTATDVYALGVLLFELLTGQLPHRRNGVAPEGMADALARDTAERPSLVLKRETAEIAQRAYGTRAIERERFARAIGGDLDRIVLTALRREPERRYASAAALGEDLRLFLDGRPIAARADTSGYRLRKFVRRHRVAALATVLVLLSLIGGLGTALWQAGIARRHAADALREAQRAEQQAQRAERVKNFVVSLFEGSNPERARQGSKITAQELVQDAALRIEKELVDAPDSQAELRVTLGQSLVALGAVPEGLALIEAGVEQLRQLHDERQPVLADALHSLAMHYEVVGRLDEADTLTREALAILAHYPNTHALQRVSARTTLAKLAGLRGDLAGAEALHRQNLDERRDLLGPDDPRLAVDWNNIAATALRRDRYLDAEQAYDQAMRLLARDPTSPQSRQAWLRAGRGFALSGRGQIEAAERELLAALDIAERTLHARHPIVGTICIGLSALTRHAPRLDEAARYAQRAMELFAPINHPDQGIAELHYGLARLSQGRDVEAEALLRAAERHYVERRSRDEAQYWHARAALGLAQLRGGDANANAAIDEALAALKQREFTQSNVYAEVLGLMAEAVQFSGDLEGAAGWRRQEYDALKRLLGVTHPRTRAAQQRLTRIDAASAR